MSWMYSHKIVNFSCGKVLLVFWLSYFTILYATMYCNVYSKIKCEKFFFQIFTEIQKFFL